jgi:hypothetical protein
MRLHRPADDPTAARVEYDSEIQEAGHRQDIRYVGDPKLVRSVGGEIPVHQIRGRTRVAIPLSGDDAVQSMSANQAFFAIATMARVLGVSTAGYYAWSSRLPSARAIADDALLRRVRTIHAVSRGTYGAPRDWVGTTTILSDRSRIMPNSLPSRARLRST